MSVPSFESVKTVYEKLWDDLVPTPSRMPELTKIAQRALDHKTSYQAVAKTVWGTPDYWYVVALIDQMEGGGGANTYLGNGQSLSRPTTEVPAGRGPFASFHDGAVDALHLDGLDKIKDWSAASLGYHLEGYNGWGYLSKPIVSPYIASWSNLYTRGKYVADHVYDPNAVSQQPGALTILKVLTTLDKTISLDGTPKKEPPDVSDLTDIIDKLKGGVTGGVPAKLDLDFSTLEPLVEQLLPLIGAIFPAAKPFIPIIQMVARTLLHAKPPATPPA
jgi:lysozyme family protein